MDDDTQADWDSWKHPFRHNLPHPFVPSFPVPFDGASNEPKIRAMCDRHSHETTNYRYLMNSLSRPTITFELQDISPNHTFSLEELHSFCGKASGLYAIADLRKKPRMEPRQVGLCGRLYGEWFNLVESDSTHEVRFFARFMQTDGLDVVDIVARHRALSQQLETQMKDQQVVEGGIFVCRDERSHRGKCTLLPSFKNLVIIVEEQSFRAHALLFVLDPGLAQGIKEMEGAEEVELSGQKAIRLRAVMEDIMRAVVAMQKKSAVEHDGITGCYREN